MTEQDAQPKVGLFDLAVAEEIRAEMARQRMTATEMYRRSGIPSSTFSRYWVQPAVSAPLEKLRAVAAALGVTPGELITRADRALADREAAGYDEA